MPDPLIIEVWRPVVGHEDAYEVSSFGRVRSLDRWVHRKRKNAAPELLYLAGKMLTGTAHVVSGHIMISLGRSHRTRVHHLVLKAFVGPCPAGQEGLHGDGHPENNRLDNLKWGTRSANVKDRKWHTPPRGYLGAMKVIEIKRLLHQGVPGSKIAKQFGVSHSTISSIKHGVNYADVSADM